MKVTAILSSILFVSGLAVGGGCTASVDTEKTDFYNDPPAEPDLSPTEAAVLPADNDVDHADDLAAELAAEPAETDASAYDNDDVEAFVDVDGTAADDVGAVDRRRARQRGCRGGDGQIQVGYYAAILKWGLHPRASDALRAAGVTASRIMQTIGNAPASAGTHAQDGTFQGHPYSAATDISVSGLSQTQIANLLERLAKVGVAAWYRPSGHDGWNGVHHLHAVYANCLMKKSPAPAGAASSSSGATGS